MDALNILLIHLLLQNILPCTKTHDQKTTHKWNKPHASKRNSSSSSSLIIVIVTSILILALDSLLLVVGAVLSGTADPSSFRRNNSVLLQLNMIMFSFLIEWLEDTSRTDSTMTYDSLLKVGKYMKTNFIHFFHFRL